MKKQEKSNTKKLVLIDAHAVIHRAYHALPEFATSAGEPTGALYGLAAMLIKLIGDLKPDYMAACFDLPGPTYRHEAYESYKAGRVKAEDSLVLQLERAKDIFTAFGVPIYSSPGFEADDIIGTIVEKFKDERSLDIIIASGDMDTLQLADDKHVQVYTLKKGISDTVTYDEKKVVERFGFPPKLLPDFKGLRGDPSDNIVGIAGIGEKTATTLVCEFGTIENIYKKLKKSPDDFKKAGLSDRLVNLLKEGEEEALFSKTLATIRTDAPINFALPAHWRENLDLDRAQELFARLEFRTMGERLRQLVEKSDVVRKNALSSPAGDARSTPADAVRDVFSPQHPISKEENQELCVMLWVVDSNITNPSIEDVFRFTKTRDIEQSRRTLEEELDKRQSRSVFEEIEKPLLPIVEKMNERGIKIGEELLKKLSRDYHDELDKLEASIWEMAGEEFNVNSPKVLGEIIFNKLGLADKRQKRTAGGALSTKESELIKIKDKHPIIGAILDYRELSKLLSTYIDAIPPLLDKKSRLHSTFLQAGTTTGRMASTNPNLQNIPIKTELGRAIRHAFIAEKGYKLVALDYSQIELRIAAMLSGDEKLIEIFKSGTDVHAGVASRVFKVAPEDVSKAMRIKAKTINFGILYGMGVNALKANLGTDRKEAQEFYNEYFQTFATLASYLDEIKALAEEKGYTETMFGRRRYFSGFKSPLPYVRAQAERMAINAPIQGTEADIVKLAMIKTSELIEKKGWDAHLLLNVHDEIVYEVKARDAEEAAREFKRIMEDVIPARKTRGVPVVAEIGIGDNWGEMQ